MQTKNININLIDVSKLLKSIDNEQKIIEDALLNIAEQLQISNCAAFAFCKEQLIFKNIKGNIPETADISFVKFDKLSILDSSDSQQAVYINMGYSYAFPLIISDDMYVLCCIEKKPNAEQISLEENYFLSMLSMIMSNSVHILNYKHALRTEKNTITTLFDISRDLIGLSTEDEIARRLSVHIMGKFALNNFAFYYKSLDTHYSIIKEFNLNGIASNIDICSFPFNDANYIKISETENVDNIKAILKNDNAEFIIKLSQNKGLVLIGKRMIKKEFSQQDIDFIISIGNLALMAIEEQKKKAIEAELDMALKIQQALLPKENPTINNYSLIGMTKSAKIVGGDYYDFMKIGDKHLIVIADACGKSISAALIMANLQSALKTLLHFVSDLTSVLTHLNTIIYENTEPDIFVTLFIGILDNIDNTFTYINAGHTPPIFVTNQPECQTVMLSEGGIILGIMEPLPFAYQQNCITLSENDLILFYTDGVTEAKNSNNVLIGEEWLINLVQQNIELSAPDLLTKINHELSEYTIEQSDDITLIALKQNNLLHQIQHE